MTDDKDNKMLKENQNIDTPNNIIEDSQTQKDDKSAIDFQLQVDSLTKELSQSQYRYVELYNNYKIIEKQLNDNKLNEKKDKIFFAIKDMSQIINNLYNFINLLPEDLKNNESIKWLIITYDNYIKSLEAKNIYVINSLGQTPTNMHDIIAKQEITDYDKKILLANGILVDNLTDKIINQFELGFYYDNNWQKEIIKPAKVILWM